MNVISMTIINRNIKVTKTKNHQTVMYGGDGGSRLCGTLLVLIIAQNVDLPMVLAIFKKISKTAISPLCYQSVTTTLPQF